MGGLGRDVSFDFSGVCVWKNNFFKPSSRKRTESPVCAWKYSYYYVNEMLYKSMSENNDNSAIFKLSVLFQLP